MKKPVDLYDSHYGRVEAPVYRAVRAETYGEDLGQTSWITASECDELAGWLELSAGRTMLEVACGSGGIAVRLAERLGADVTGVDVNPSAVAASTARAKSGGLQDRTRFLAANADEALPFPDRSFDAIFCNDAINHLRDRARLFADWRRLLRPRGRCLFTDPVVVTGWVTKDELEARSSIGFFLFTPPGVNESLLAAAGLRLARKVDLTESVARSSQRWRDARARHRRELCELEGEEKFEGLQRFLATVHSLSSERRLSRFGYLAERPE